MSDRIYVIPGNHSEGAMYAREHCGKRYAAGDTSASLSDYVVVEYGRADKLMGVRNPHGVFMGTWQDRKDLREICIQLSVCHQYGNAVIKKIMKEKLGY